MATPHRGSIVASWAGYLAHAVRAAQLFTGTNSNLLSLLGWDSTALSDISSQFVERGAKLQIRTFYETEILGFMNSLVYTLRCTSQLHGL